MSEEHLNSNEPTKWYEVNSNNPIKQIPMPVEWFISDQDSVDWLGFDWSVSGKSTDKIMSTLKDRPTDDALEHSDVRGIFQTGCTLFPSLHDYIGPDDHCDEDIPLETCNDQEEKLIELLAAGYPALRYLYDFFDRTSKSYDDQLNIFSSRHLKAFGTILVGIDKWLSHILTFSELEIYLTMNVGIVDNPYIRMLQLPHFSSFLVGLRADASCVFKKMPGSYSAEAAALIENAEYSLDQITDKRLLHKYLFLAAPAWNCSNEYLYRLAYGLKVLGPYALKPLGSFKESQITDIDHKLALRNAMAYRSINDTLIKLHQRLSVGYDQYHKVALEGENDGPIVSIHPKQKRNTLQAEDCLIKKRMKLIRENIDQIASHVSENSEVSVSKCPTDATDKPAEAMDTSEPGVASETQNSGEEEADATPSRKEKRRKTEPKN